MDTATVSGHLVDLVGDFGVPATVTLTAVPASSHGIRAGNDVRVLTGRFDTDATGYLSLTIPKLPQSGYENVTWRAEVKPRGYQKQPFTLVFGLTADSTWGALARYVPPVVAPPAPTANGTVEDSTAPGLYASPAFVEDATGSGLYLPGAAVEDTAAGLYLL